MSAVERSLILVLDDEPDVEEVIGAILRRHRLEGRICSSPERAVECFSENHYNVGLAILDIVMPKMSGIEVARRFLQIDPEVPVILMTGMLDSPDSTTLPPNIKKVLHKPLTQLELIGTIWIFKTIIHRSGTGT